MLYRLWALWENLTRFKMSACIYIPIKRPWSLYNSCTFGHPTVAYSGTCKAADKNLERLQQLSQLAGRALPCKWCFSFGFWGFGALCLNKWNVSVCPPWLDSLGCAIFFLLFGICSQDNGFMTPPRIPLLFWSHPQTSHHQHRAF